MSFLTHIALCLATLSAPAEGLPALMLQGGAPLGAWSQETRGCEDGEARRLFSSLPRGEMGTGVLVSPDFDAPASLSFFVAGHSRQERNEVRLVDAASGAVLRRTPPTGSDQALSRTWNLADVACRAVRVELVDGDTGTGWAWLCAGGFDPAVVPEDPAAWREEAFRAGQVVVDGVPFARQGFWRGGAEGAATELPVGGVRAKHLWLLAGTHQPDTAGPGWGGCDDHANHFIGDAMGAVEVVYASGTADTVPLLFGYTLWWRAPYRFAPAPFDSDAEVRAMTEAALCVGHGLDGYAPSAPPCCLRIALRDEPVTALRLVDEAGKLGHPAVEGITFTGLADGATPEGFETAACEPLAADRAAWYDTHTVASADPFPAARREAVAALRRRFSTALEDVTHATVSATPLGFDPAELPGPVVSFSGPPEAEILGRVYAESVREMLRRVMDDGMVHESAPDAPNYGGFGGWRPDLHPFYNNAYTRNRTAALLTLLGETVRADRVNDFFDRWVMYFPGSFPDLQLGGEPVPGHATVIANQPHVYFDSLRAAGWPTRYTTRDYGNPETDGQGFNMLGHWRAWNKAGRDTAWVRARWEALRETAEYVPWCLEHPDLSFAEHGLLYAESEGGMQLTSLYANTLVYYGLLGYADMADAVGEADLAARWRNTATGLAAALDAWAVKEDPDHGVVWDPAKAAGWGYDQGVLAPVLFAADRYGWDIAGQLPEGWLARTERSYDLACTRLRPGHCAPAGFGYGQGYFTQAALLLDRMADAGPMLEWMARLCFAPRLPHPYRVPEGAVVTEGGREWRRWGDLGNLYQMNEAQYTVHVVMGVDDLDERCLRLVPRVPADWAGMDLRGYPVRTRSGGVPRTVHVDVRLDRNGDRLTVQLNADHVVDAWRMRLGPFPADATAVTVTRGGQTAEVPAFAQGDAAWAWVSGGGETEAQAIVVR